MGGGRGAQRGLGHGKLKSLHYLTTDQAKLLALTSISANDNAFLPSLKTLILLQHFYRQSIMLRFR